MSFLLSLFFPLLLLLGVTQGGAAVLAPTLLFFPLIPLFDSLSSAIGVRAVGPGSDRIAKPVLLAWAILYPLAVWQCAIFVSRMGLFTFEGIGITVSASLVGSVAIVAAHDLIHKSNGQLQKFGFFILWHVGYMHFGILHRAGHHRYVGTKRDHSTAWLNETVYSYLFRTIRDCYLATWKLENKRMKQAGRPALSPQNNMIWFSLLPILLFALFWSWLGLSSATFYFLQAFVAVIMLETVSYIQHYGLLRKEDSSGALEPLQDQHSWDYCHPVSNAFLLNIQVHASHHRRPSKWFHQLQPSRGALQLPYCYPVLIQLSFAPVAWRKLMHPLLSGAGMLAAQTDPLQRFAPGLSRTPSSHNEEKLRPPQTQQSP